MIVMIAMIEYNEETDETYVKYEMPSVIKNMLSEKALVTFRDNLSAKFNIPHKLTYNNDIAYMEGTFGWYDALEDMCEKHGLNDLLEYYDSLEWYDSDKFDGVISDMLLERGLIEEGEQDEWKF